MKVFVTGGTGFVGSHLVEALLANGHVVACLVRNPRKAERLFGERQPKIIRGDLSDTKALAAGATGADIVFHVAALTAARSRTEFFALNETATARVLSAAAGPPGHLRRFVYVSSLAAAGPSHRGRALQGGEPENPVTHYGASKLAGELAVRSSSLAWTIVRPPTVYGPRDVALLKLFRLARKGVVPVFGDGAQELSLIYVEDLARALIAAAISPETESKTYFACHPEIIRTRALVTAVHRTVRTNADATPLVIPIPGPAARAALWVTGTAARLAGRATLLSPDKANEFLAAAWTCSPAALECDTGWTAGFDLSAGLASTVAWYRKHGWL